MRRTPDLGAGHWSSGRRCRGLGAGRRTGRRSAASGRSRRRSEGRSRAGPCPGRRARGPCRRGRGQAQHPGARSPRWRSGRSWSSSACFWVLGRFAWKPLSQALHQREEHLEHCLLQTEKARNESEQLLAEHRRLMAAGRRPHPRCFDKAQKDAQASGRRDRAGRPRPRPRPPAIGPSATSPRPATRP